MFTYSLLGVFIMVGCWRPAVAMENLDSILHKVGHEIQEVREHMVSLHHRLHHLLDLAHRGIAHASKIKNIANDNKDQPVSQRERTTFDRFVDPNSHIQIQESRNGETWFISAKYLILARHFKHFLSFCVRFCLRQKLKKMVHSQRSARKLISPYLRSSKRRTFGQCWATVYDAGSALAQFLVIAEGRGGGSQTFFTPCPVRPVLYARKENAPDITLVGVLGWLLVVVCFAPIWGGSLGIYSVCWNAVL